MYGLLLSPEIEWLGEYMCRVKLYNGDCLDVMNKLIEDKVKVDAIITSPPYNMCLRVSKDGKYRSRWWSGNKGHFSNKYTNYKDDLPIEEYERIQTLFLEKALTLSDYVFYNIQMITGNKIPLLHIMGKFADKIKDIIIWDKGNAQPAINKGCLNSQYEFIIVFSNVRPHCRTFDNACFERGTETNIWNNKRERNTKHRAGFPVSLIERVLTNFTVEGNTILDPFMGSGTTGVACINNKRNFIGIELDSEYYGIAKDRLKETIDKLKQNQYNNEAENKNDEPTK